MVLVLNVIFSTARSTTFEMPFLQLFTNWKIFCILVKKNVLSICWILPCSAITKFPISECC